MTGPVLVASEETSVTALDEPGRSWGWGWGWASLPRWTHAGIGVVLIIIVWHLIAVIGFRKTHSVPTPFAVVGQVVSDLGDPTVWKAIGITFQEAIVGYLIGNLVALVLAGLVLLVPWLEGITTQLAVIVSCVPLTAIAPLIVLVSPTSSRAGAVVLAAMGVFYTTVIGSLLGLKAVDAAAIDLVQAYGGTRLTALRKVRVIAALPNVMSALTIAAPAAFVGAILGEFFLNGVDSGLGIQIQAAQIHYGPKPLWALALLSAAVAGAFYSIMTMIARAVTPWGASTGQRAAG